MAARYYVTGHEYPAINEDTNPPHQTHKYFQFIMGQDAPLSLLSSKRHRKISRCSIAEWPTADNYMESTVGTFYNFFLVIAVL